MNVGRSEDETLALVRSIGDPKIRIVETEWDMTRRNTVLGHETLRAMRACSHPWGIYIQADEVLHERGRGGAGRRRSASTTRDPRVEGLLVRYLHFYGGFDTIATHRRWYRREVRAVRLDPALDIRPYQGAQGFRVGPEHRKIRARLTDAEMFHYGWARPAQALREKRELGKTMYPWRNAERTAAAARLDPRDASRSGRATRPRRGSGSRPAASIPSGWSRPRRFRWRFLRYYLSAGDRAADRGPGVRVPKLHDRLTERGAARTPCRQAAAPPAGRRCGDGARAAGPPRRCAAARLRWRGSAAPARPRRRSSGTRRSARPPTANHSISRTKASEVEPAASHDLPHAVGGRRSLLVLCWLGVRAKRDGRAADHLPESPPVDWAAGHRQVLGRTVPPGSTQLEPATAAHGPKDRVAMGVLARTHEARVTSVGVGCPNRWAVERGIDPLRQKPHVRNAGGPVLLHLAEARGVHPAHQTAEGNHLWLRLQIEVPERGLAPADGTKRRFAHAHRVAGDQDEVGLEGLDPIADHSSGECAGVSGPAYDVHQPAGVSQGPRRTYDRRFGLVAAARSEDDDAHRPSITTAGADRRSWGDTHGRG